MLRPKVPTVQVVLVDGPYVQLERARDAIIQSQDGEDLGQEVANDQTLSSEVIDVFDLHFQ